MIGPIIRVAKGLFCLLINITEFSWFFNVDPSFFCDFFRDFIKMALKIFPFRTFDVNFALFLKYFME